MRSSSRRRLSILAVLLIVCGASPGLSQNATAPLPFPHITVSGAASAEVRPDLAEIVFAIVTKNTTASETTEENARLSTSAMASLRKLGVDDKDIRTVNLSLDQVFVEEKDPKTQAVLSPKPNGFQAINRIAARIHDLARVGEIASALVDTGANRIEDINFQLTDETRRLDAVRAESVLDALRKARLYSDSADSKLGEIYEIVTENLGAEGAADLPAKRFDPAPHPINIPISPGMLRLWATTTITWKLAPK